MTGKLLVILKKLSTFIFATIFALIAVSNPEANGSAVAFVLSRTSTNGAASPNHSCKSSLQGLEDSFQDGTLEVSRNYVIDGTSTSTSHSLHYRIHNRMNLSSQKAAPILVLHGGPGIPSDYLYPLKNVVPYRSLLYYDQLGCGRSPGPECLDAYSIEKSLDDLELLIKKLSLRRFHLYGQSFGGILAFEYIKRMAEKSANNNNSDDQPECLSVVLSSSPSSVEQVEASVNALIQGLLEEDDDPATLAERFRLQNQCRVKEKPQALVNAYAHAGTVWRGSEVIQGWRAERPVDGARRMPSAMVMRGEYDFVTQECIKGWKKAFNHPFVRIKVLDGCSHHGLLENGEEYGEIVNSFFAEYD